MNTLVLQERHILVLEADKVFEHIKLMKRKKPWKESENIREAKKYDVSYETTKWQFLEKPTKLSNKLYENTFAVLW